MVLGQVATFACTTGSQNVGLSIDSQFSHYAAALVCGLLHHWITSLPLLLTGRLISLSDFQTGIGAAAHSTLDTEQHISHATTALFDIIAPYRV